MTLIKAHQPCMECGSTDALSVYDNGSYCFSCHFKSHDTTRSLIEHRQSPVTLDNYSLPADACDDFPIDARLWLYSSNITDERIQDYNIKYSPSHNAVILPYYRDTEDEIDKLLFFQIKTFDEGKPKYITKGTGLRLFYTHDAYFTSTIVITEDILSAIRLSYFQASMSICGTGLDSAGLQLNNILSNKSKHFIIWLDPDNAGKRGASKLAKQLSLYGRVSVINSTRDPKNHTNEEIEKYLSGV